MTLTRFAKYSWGVLVYSVLVILFGAFVRATGSGAGCGAHWPLCNGVVIPQPQRLATMIEFTHRVTSGLSVAFIFLLLVWAWRSYGKGSKMRLTSALAMLFIIGEALIGAGLVLWQLVEQNDSVARAVTGMAHLVNTFLLTASLAITAWWATFGEPQRLRKPGGLDWLVILGGVGILLLGATGAVTALGDTLYPTSSVAQGLYQDFSPAASYLTRLRIYHPAIAIGVGVYIFAVTYAVRRKWVREEQNKRLETVTSLLFGLYILQIFLGMMNVALFAPVWMQIVHLLVSNLVWLAFVLMGVVLFGGLDLVAGLSDHVIHHPVGETTH